MKNLIGLLELGVLIDKQEARLADSYLLCVSVCTPSVSLW